MTWPRMKVADLCQLVRGSSPRPQGDPRYFGGPVPRLMIEDLTRDGKYVTPKVDSLTVEGAARSRPMQQGELVMTVSGRTGVPAILAIDACIHDGFVGFRELSPMVNTEYLFYYFSLLTEQTNSKSVGAIFKNLTTDQIKNLEVPLPPLEVQQRIADTLDTADALRRKDQELLRKYDELAQSIFYETFGNPEHNTEGWEVQKFGSLIHNIKAGTSLGGEDRELNPGEFGVLKISAVTTGIFKPQEYKVPVQSDIVKERVTVKKGDLLFSRANTRELVGAVAIVEDTYPALMLPDKLWRIDLHADQMLNYYCKAILTDKSVRYTLTQTATGSSGSMLNISMGKLRDLEIPVPPLELQEEFEEVSKKLLAQKRLVEKAAAQSEGLFNSLLGSYFA